MRLRIIHLFAFIAILSTSIPTALGQMTTSNSSSYITPSGLLDNVYDQFGNQYHLQDIAVNDSLRSVGGSVTPSSPTGPQSMVIASCSSGYFQLYLDSACGLDSYSTNSVQNARLQVFCQVLNDISSFIISPLSSTGQKVKIWVRRPSSMGLPSNAGGEATSFFIIPNASASGIVDNTVWETILSGKDAYQGVASPLTGSGSFFHAAVAFNFTAYNWNLSLTTAPTSSQIDLYSTVLHEFMHALGIRSLISSTGASQLPYPYYTRFDQHIKSGTTPLITQTSGTCSPMYNYSYTASTNAIQPNALQCYPDSTVCGTALSFVGTTTLVVYTPNCWEPGSSISHFEDKCPPISNSQYYVMSPRQGYGYMERALAPEERLALCDLGYNVRTTFGNSIYLNYTTYSGSTCPGVQVAGMNDGIDTNGYYTYVTLAGTPVTINSSTLVHSLLSNDVNADSVSCLEVVTGGTGTFNVTSGNTNTFITYTPSSSSVQGMQLLRYVPVNRTTGKTGNITYVYIRVSTPNCVGSSCSMIVNGGFESSVGCGCITLVGNNNIPTLIDCWDQISGSPDLYSTSCMYPYANGWDDTKIPTSETVPATNVHPGSANPNNHFLGLTGGSSGGAGFFEGVQTTLATGLIPGTTYKLSYWIKVAGFDPDPSMTAFDLVDSPGHVQFCASTGPIAGSVQSSSISYPFPSGIIPLTDTVIPADGQWHAMTQTFTYAGSATLNNFIVLNATYLNPSNYPANYSDYLFFDDFSLSLADSIHLTIPDTLTTCDTLYNLMSYVTGISTGSFSGYGVVTSGSQYNYFAALAAAINGVGLQNVTFTYVDANGCTRQIVHPVYIRNTNPSVTASTNVDTACKNQQITLTASGGSHYIWYPSAGLSCDTCAITYAYPADSTLYSVFCIDSNHCPSVASVQVNVPDTAIIFTNDTAGFFACYGHSVRLFASLNPIQWNSNNPLNFGLLPGSPAPDCSYQWYRNGSAIGGSAGQQFFYVATQGGIYTVGIKVNNLCTIMSDAITVTIDTPSITISPAPTWFCAGSYMTLTASNSYPTMTWTHAYFPPGTYTTVGSGVSLNATLSGVYKLTVIDAHGCTNFTTDTTTVYSPNALISPSATTVLCPGGSVNFTANTATGLSYIWLFNGAAISSATSSAYTASSAGNYAVAEIDSHGCMDTSLATIVTAGSAPAATISPSGAFSICSGTSQTLTANTGTGYTYVWQYNPGSGWTTLSSTTNTTSASAAGLYRVIVTNSSGCSTTSANDTIILTGLPTATVSAASATLCPGYTTDSLFASTGTGYTYQWKLNGTNITGATASKYAAANTGSYSVTVTANGCSATSSTTILSAGPSFPSAVMAYYSLATLCTATADTLISYSTGAGYHYTWYYNGSLVASDTTYKLPFTATGTATYELILTAPGYCPTSSGVDTIHVSTDPCNLCHVFNGAGYTKDSSGTLSGTLTGYHYIDTNTTISSATTFNGAVVFMAPGVKLTVTSGATLTVKGSHLFSCGTHTWKGIRTSGNETVVVENNSLVEDADTAIIIGGNSTLSCSNAIFNKDVNGVYIHDISSPATSLSVSNTIFTCRNITSGYSYPFTWVPASTYKSSISTGTSYPYESVSYGAISCNNGLAANAGIILSNLGSTSVSSYPFTFNETTIGTTSSAGNQNVFDNLQNGILANNTNVTSLNNEFIYCGNGINYNSNVNLFYGRLRLWNNSSSLNNRFYDCINGVLAQNAFEVIGHNTYMISNHTTSSTTRGMFGFDLVGGNYHDVHLDSNMLINLTNGISVIKPYVGYVAGLQFRTAPAIVYGQGTYITQDTVLAVPWGNSISHNEFTKLGINAQMVTNVTYVPTEPLYCDSNHIHNAYTGILINNLRNTTANIKGDYINTQYDPSGNAQAAIYDWYSWLNSITENTLVGTGVNSYDSWRGLYAANNSYLTIDCNLADSLTRDFEFVGLQGLHTAWYKNTMGYSGKGFVLNGIIGHQGATGHPIGNVWSGSTWNNTGTGWQTYTISNTIPTNSTLYVDAANSPAYNTNVLGQGPPDTYSSSNGLSITTGPYPTTCIKQPVSRAAGDFDNFENVALNNITYGNNESITRWMAQLQLYQSMTTDSTLFDSSSILPVFYDSATDSRFGYLMQIENYIVEGYLDSAGTLLKMDVPANPTSDVGTGVIIADSTAADGIVSNYKTFYGAFINYLNSTMSSADSSTVTTIANLCPSTNGGVVYQARALYAILYNDLTVFDDDPCYTESHRAASQPDNNGNTWPTLPILGLQQQKYMLHPNPTDGHINIVQAVPDTRPVLAQIWDMEGKLMFRQPLVFNANTVQLNLDLMPGLYLLQLTDSQGKEYTLKFVVNYN